MKRALQLCCWTLNKCSKLETTTDWKNQTSRMHCTRQGIFFIAEFQNSIISEFNHKSTVLQFSKYFNYSQFLHTENRQNCWQVATSAESQELHRRAFTPNKGSSQSGSWLGWEGPTHRGWKEDLWSLSHMPCTGLNLLPWILTTNCTVEKQLVLVTKRKKQSLQDY